MLEQRMTEASQVVEEATKTLLVDWRSVATVDHGPWLRLTGVEPGPIALRARWHYLRGLRDLPQHRACHAVGEDQWRQELDVETEADLALIRGDLALARDLFTWLREHASHPVAAVQALIGLGDAARHDDDLTTAQDWYEEAAALADDSRFSFGGMRARLPLAYLVRRSGSAEQMLATAADCEDRARNLRDRVYIANALVAKGEALDLLNRQDEAVQVLTEAVDRFRRVNSQVGVAGAGMRLLDVHRRREDAQSILDLAPAVLAATTATGQLQESVDVHDVVAFAHLHRGAVHEALDSCGAGLRAAAASYPRGTAHLRMSQGMAMRKDGRPVDAAAAFAAALGYFQNRRDEQWMSAYCLGQLALCAEDQDLPADAVELQLQALEHIEAMRSRQARPRWQQEYRTRFDTIYRGALLTCVRAQDTAAFVAVFESLWGRRLPGLADGVPLDPDADPLLIAQLLARNDRARRARLPDGTNRSSLVPRGLGRVALGGALPAMYADATDAALAGAYRPLAREQGAELVRSLPLDVAVLLICEVPGSPERIAWLAAAPGQTPQLGQRNLTPDELQVIDQWSHGWPLQGRAGSVTALSGLIPPQLQDLPDGTPLLLIPLERLWALPWAAAPVETDLLGCRFELLRSPSLTLAATCRAGSGPAISGQAGRVVACIGPAVEHHDLRGIGAISTEARSPQAAKAAHRALTSGGTDTVVVVAHGRPVDALGHYLELGEDQFLTPTELLNGTQPLSVALLSCWGARVPGESNGEPLTIATIALARGARVLTTVSELGDSPTAAAVVNDTVWKAATESWPAALRWSLRRRAAELVDEPLVDWASLAALGGW